MRLYVGIYAALLSTCTVPAMGQLHHDTEGKYSLQISMAGSAYLLEQESTKAQQLGKIDDNYRKLNLQKAALTTKLMTALGKPDEQAIYAEYRDLLEEMIQNRQQAQALGSHSAGEEIKALYLQLQKIVKASGGSTRVNEIGKSGSPVQRTNQNAENGKAGEVRIAPSTVTAPQTVAPKKINISGGVAQAMLLEKTQPNYPPIAKAARVSGTVVIQATISKTGTIENLQIISGPAMLQQAARDAVKTWRYRPYLVNGEPVEVETTINVFFILGG